MITIVPKWKVTYSLYDEASVTVFIYGFKYHDIMKIASEIHFFAETIGINIERVQEVKPQVTSVNEAFQGGNKLKWNQSDGNFNK